MFSQAHRLERAQYDGSGNSGGDRGKQAAD